MREEGKVRAARCLRLELVGDATAAVMDVAEAELAAAGAALADLAFVAVQVGRARLAYTTHWTRSNSFHLLSGWLKEVAPSNISDIRSTLDTSQLLSGWLKKVAN